MTKWPRGSGGLGMFEGVEDPAASWGQGGAGLVGGRSGVECSRVSGGARVSLWLQSQWTSSVRKTCPLVEPCTAAAWPFRCSFMTIDFFYLLQVSLSAIPSISTAYISTIFFSHFTHRITPWPASPSARTAALIWFWILGRLISGGVKQEWKLFLRQLLLGSADRPESALRPSIVRSSFGEPCRSFVLQANCFGAQPREYPLNRAPRVLLIFSFAPSLLHPALQLRTVLFIFPLCSLFAPGRNTHTCSSSISLKATGLIHNLTLKQRKHNQDKMHNKLRVNQELFTCDFLSHISWSISAFSWSNKSPYRRLHWPNKFKIQIQLNPNNHTHKKSLSSLQLLRSIHSICTTDAQEMTGLLNDSQTQKWHHRREEGAETVAQTPEKTAQHKPVICSCIHGTQTHTHTPSNANRRSKSPWAKMKAPTGHKCPLCLTSPNAKRAIKP